MSYANALISQNNVTNEKYEIRIDVLNYNDIVHMRMLAIEDNILSSF